MIIYFAILMILPLWAQHKVKSNYEKYSQVRSTSGKTGREVAEEILHANGINDVEVLEGQGFLSDHYDPTKKSNSFISCELQSSKCCCNSDCGTRSRACDSRRSRLFLLEIQTRIVPIS